MTDTTWLPGYVAPPVPRLVDRGDLDRRSEAAPAAAPPPLDREPAPEPPATSTLLRIDFPRPRLGRPTAGAA